MHHGGYYHYGNVILDPNGESVCFCPSFESSTPPPSDQTAKKSHPIKNDLSWLLPIAGLLVVFFLALGVLVSFFGG